MHPLVAEFIGTALMLVFGNGVILSTTKGGGSAWIVIATGMSRE